MKKLTIPTGGHKINYNEDLSHLSDATTENTTALASFWGADNYYLNPDSIAVVSAGNATAGDITLGGALVYKGEICLFNFQNITEEPSKVLVWIPDNVVSGGDPITYANATTQSPHVNKRVKLAYYASGSLPADYVRASDMLTPAKAVQQYVYGVWQDLTIINDWTASSNKPQVKVDADGRVSLRGMISRGSPTNDVFAVLPSNCWPAYFVSLVCANAAGRDKSVIQISYVDGSMETDRGANSSADFYLDGLSFYR